MLLAWHRLKQPLPLLHLHTPAGTDNQMLQSREQVWNGGQTTSVFGKSTPAKLASLGADVEDDVQSLPLGGGRVAGGAGAPQDAPLNARIRANTGE